jgi:hypothetical protein
MATFWAIFCLSKSITFSTKCAVQNMVYVVGILMLQEWFDVDILDFQFELCDRFFYTFF